MNIEIIVDPKQCLGNLTDLEQRQVPFALSKAVNATALDVQTSVRARQRKIFTLRRPDWADRSVKMVKFAKKIDPSATIGIHPPGGDQRADIITKFEADTQKISRTGGRVAIPVGAKSAGVIRGRNRPRAMIEAARAFVLQSRNPAVQLIVRRAARGKRALETLYLLVKRVRISPVLRFHLTAAQRIDERFQTHMLTAFDDAMRTAK